MKKKKKKDEQRDQTYAISLFSVNIIIKKKKTRFDELYFMIDTRD